MTEEMTHKSLVRPMTSDDLERVLSWRNHPEVRSHMFMQHEITMDEHKSWFDCASKDPRKHLLIFESDNKAQGFVSFNQLANEKIAEWGFYVAPDVLKGSGRQLGHVALTYAFSQLKFHKVCGQVLAYNERSFRFHKSLGFQQEGELRDQHYKDARYHHVIFFGLLNHEWQSHA